MQDYDVLSRCHPAVNFLFFAAAIVLTVVLFHPAYLLVSLLCGGAYYAVLRQARCIKTLGFLFIAMVLVAAVNPLFNTLGETPSLPCSAAPTPGKPCATAAARG